MIPIISIVIITATAGSQSGAVTHHQDQFATSPQPPSLSVRNIRNRIVPILKPVDAVLFSAILFSNYLKIRYPFVSTKFILNCLRHKVSQLIE